MRRIALAISLIAGMFPAAVSADERPVVVELFTSQGCSSCPPADRFLAELAKSDDVIALAWHVDYWDYLGWQDHFADPAFTDRQKRYAHAMDEKMIYTPQVIVDGMDHTVGSDAARVMRLMKYARQHEAVINLEAERVDDLVEISAKAIGAPQGAVDVSVIQYLPQAQVEISRGENAGSTFTYTNIVTTWTKAGTWNGRGTLTVDAPVQADQPVVVMLQEKGNGMILAALELD